MNEWKYEWKTIIHQFEVGIRANLRNLFWDKIPCKLPIQIYPQIYPFKTSIRPNWIAFPSLCVVKADIEPSVEHNASHIRLKFHASVRSLASASQNHRIALPAPRQRLMPFPAPTLVITDLQICPRRTSAEEKCHFYILIFLPKKKWKKYYCFSIWMYF